MSTPESPKAEHRTLHLAEPQFAPVARESKHAIAEPPRTSSDVLLGSSRELLIEHGGALYRLRATRNGKLILTK